MLDHKLSTIIQYKLPEFVRSDNELYVAFVKAYVEYLEQEGNALHFLQRFQRNQDIDRADDDFMEQYIRDFAGGFPKATQIPTNQLLKLIREFYLSKGSEDSFRFIFRVLYDADIEIQYPREQMYVPSSGEYVSELVANITGNNWFKLNLDGDINANIEGVDSGAVGVIDSITSTFVGGQQTLQLEISSAQGSFIPGEDVQLTVNDTVVTETMYGAVNAITVTDGGSNYKIDDEITITDATGIRARAKIAKLGKGPLTQVNIIGGGYGYQVGDVVKATRNYNTAGYGFRAYVYEVDDEGAITRVRIEDGGYNYSEKSPGVVSSSTGSAAVLEFNGDDIGKIEQIEVFDGGIGYQDAGTIDISINSEEGSGAVLTPVLSGIFSGPKRYRTEKSTLSGNSKIMDSYYYQQYSYVIASEISPHEWLGQIKRIGHPAGTELFGMFRLTSEGDVSVGVAPDNVAYARNLSFEYEMPSGLEFGLITERELEIYSDDSCSLGSTVRDLDFLKFQPNFNWGVGAFGSETIDSVSGGLCATQTNKVESSILTIE